VIAGYSLGNYEPTRPGFIETFANFGLAERYLEQN
jgi:hypothetical protein